MLIGLGNTMETEKHKTS